MSGLKRLSGRMGVPNQAFKPKRCGVFNAHGKTRPGEKSISLRSMNRLSLVTRSVGGFAYKSPEFHLQRGEHLPDTLRLNGGLKKCHCKN